MYETVAVQSTHTDDNSALLQKLYTLQSSLRCNFLQDTYKIIQEQIKLDVQYLWKM